MIHFGDSVTLAGFLKSVIIMPKKNAELSSLYMYLCVYVAKSVRARQTELLSKEYVYFTFCYDTNCSNLKFA